MELKNFQIWDWKLAATLVAIIFAAFYVYLKRTYGYWKTRGFPEISLKPVPFFGHIFSLVKGKSFADTFNDLYKYAGDKPFVGYFHGSQPAILLKNPEIIKQVLVKDFHAFADRTSETVGGFDSISSKGLFELRGQKWKEMRARLSPTFTSGRMKAMFPLMMVCAEELNESLSKNIERNGGEGLVEIKEYMACYATDVIATCAFGIRCDALKNKETSEFRRMGKRIIEPTWRRGLVMAVFLISPKLLKWTGLKFTDDMTTTFFTNFVKDIVEEREKAIEQSEKDGGNGPKFGDFIHHLVLLKKRGLHFKDESDDDEAEVDGSHQEHNQTEGEPSWTNIDNDDLTAQVMLFFSGGFEPTSTVLSFALFELSSTEHGREIQKKLREEIDRVMEEEGGKLTYYGLKKMHLLDRVISETLRIYPPAGFLFRTANQPYTFPGTTLKIEKDIPVFIPAYSMQLDERFFPNPTHFDPDRFLPENKENMKQFSFLPFGEGPRVCIGERFAQMQCRLGIASVLSKFEFEVCREKTDVPMKFKKRAFMLTAEKGIWLRAIHRRDKK